MFNLIPYEPEPSFEGVLIIDDTDGRLYSQAELLYVGKEHGATHLLLCYEGTKHPPGYYPGDHVFFVMPKGDPDWVQERLQHGWNVGKVHII